MKIFLGALLMSVLAGCSARPALVCYSGPNMASSMRELAATWSSRTGVKVSVESNEPRKLIDRLVGSPASADLLVTHDSFLDIAMARGIDVERAWCVASLDPVIAVRKGNPKQITWLGDLARPGVRVGLTDSTATISGHIVAVMLQKAGVAKEVEANVVTRTAQGRDLAAAIIAGQVDAGIVWNAVVFNEQDALESVAIDPKFHPAPGAESIVQSPTMGRLELDYVRVTIAVLSQGKSPASAADFAAFAASTEGAAVFARHGFSPRDPVRPVEPIAGRRPAPPANARVRM